MNTETEKSGDWRADVRPYRGSACAKVICYYGSKWRHARHYPAPQHDTIIEPFAGSAGYALHYPEKSVHLYDLNEKICAVWDYVIRVNPDEIRRLPILAYGERVNDHSDTLPQEARWLIGWWLGFAGAGPRDKMGALTHKRAQRGALNTWTPRRREAVAQTSERVKHWTITRGSYVDIEDQRATWFIDPPYQCKAGRHYTHNAIDFQHLAQWSRSRSGQIIVCENTNSERWLPFDGFRATKGTTNKKTNEVIWYQSDSSESSFDDLPLWSNK